MLVLLLALLQVSPIVDNAYVRAVRNAAPCGEAQAACGRRVIVALGPITLTSSGGPSRTLSRGQIAVFAPAESYEVRGDAFVEVAIKANHPPATRPPDYLPPEKNRRLYDSDDLFIFEEQLAPGDTRPRHGHAERLVIVVNDTRLQQWQDDGQEVFKHQVPDDVHFNQPVAHKVVNVGTLPLRNIVIEFKSQEPNQPVSQSRPSNRAALPPRIASRSASDTGSFAIDSSIDAMLPI